MDLTSTDVADRSASRPRLALRKELKAVALAVALVITFDLLVGVASRRLTVDAQHVEAIPELVASLEGAEGTTVLFVGNSVTREGVDVDAIEAVAPDSLNVKAVALHPDDTTIADWLPLYDHFVAGSGVEPDLVVVPFVTGQLRDDRETNPSRIGRDYTATGDLVGRLRDLDGLSPRFELVMAHLSNTYANRERLSRRGLELLPRYPELVQGINAEAVEDRDAALEDVQASYERLRRLRDVVRSGGGRLVIVAMPTRFDYSIDETLERSAAELDVELIDLRMVDVSESDFRDGLHLKESGAQVVTATLAEQLWPGA